MAKLLETTRTKRDCEQLDEINARSLTPLSCPPDKALSRSMASFEVVGAEAYGTGAVVDYTSGELKDGAALVLFAAPDRRWGVSRFGVLTGPSTETSDEQSRDGFRKAVDHYLAAIEAGDCKSFMEVTFTGDAGRREVCATTFRATRRLRTRLKADPGVVPKYQGGNATYGFFTLETSRPEPLNVTISVVEAEPEAPSPYVILNAAASPTAEQQQRAIEGLERSESVAQPEKSPSRKADSP